MMAAGDKQVLPFSVLAILATAPDGSLVDGKIKSLIRLLRPDVSARGIAYRIVPAIASAFTNILSRRDFTAPR